MTQYKVTAKTATGNIYTQTIIEASEAKAKKAFREIYRNGEKYTITSVEVEREDVQATKQNERDALAEIKNIIFDLGPDSYIATAFEGCCEIAEENINNDFACSMKQRAESAEKKAAEAEKKIATLELDNRDLRLQINNIKQDAAATEQRLRDLAIDPDDLTDTINLTQEKITEYREKAAAAEKTILDEAENSAGQTFQQAVIDRRNAKANIEYYSKLLARLTAVQRAGV